MGGCLDRCPLTLEIPVRRKWTGFRQSIDHNFLLKLVTDPFMVRILQRGGNGYSIQSARVNGEDWK